MFLDDNLMLERAEAYAKNRGITILRKPRLGHGSDGAVWKTSVPSAVKAVFHNTAYQTELRCYRILQDAGVSKIGMFNVPVLEGSDDSLQVLEISFVDTPYLLDFGKAHIGDEEPLTELFGRQRLSESQAQWQHLFGQRWAEVSSAINILATRHGIYYTDPRPGNINCGDDDDDDWDKEPPLNYSFYDD